MEPRILIQKTWIVFLNDLLEQDSERWAELVTLAVKIAFGECENCLWDDPIIAPFWEKTEVIPVSGEDYGLIRIKEDHGDHIS